MVELNAYGAFAPRVIYIDVKRNDRLADLHDRVKKYMDKEWNISDLLRGNRPFNPHMTVAFRDLSKENFYAAWPEFKYKDFNESFQVDKIVLLKHLQKRWDIFHQAFFGKKQEFHL
jgi:2'-5' RNA ligase